MAAGCGAGAAYRPEQNANGDYIVPKSAFGDARAIKLDHKTLQVPLVLAIVDGQYHASELICPHQGCVVSVKSDKLSCPCHGSTFTFEGSLTSGPAEEDLRPRVVEEHGDFVVVLAR